MTHAVDELFDSLSMVEPYPAGVVAVPMRLPGTGFFPGGSGLWQEGSDVLPPLPIGGIMVLGHNLDSERGFAQSIARGSENLKGATWKPLTELLIQVAPDEAALTRCFFTNFLIGLIPGSSAIGAFPGTKDPAFVERCRLFLVRQIEVVRPSVLLVLGVHKPRLLAPLSPRLEDWSNAMTFSDIDRENGGVICRAVIAGVELSMVALTHPSYRRMNVRYRRFDGLFGEAAELEMIRRAASASRAIGCDQSCGGG